jgi:hypothetical protein
MGHDTRESLFREDLLELACAQNAQLAAHRFGIQVIVYNVVGSSSSFPGNKPNLIALPIETRISIESTIFLHIYFLKRINYSFRG